MEQDRRMSKRRKKKQPIWMALVYVIAAVVVILAAYVAFQYAFSAGNQMVKEEGSQQEATLGETVLVTIPEGASTKDVAEVLEENGLIDSVTMFRIHSKLNGYDGTFHFGTYELAQGMTEEQIVAILQSGQQYLESVRITIPEGYTLEQIAARVEENGLVTAEEMLAEAESGEFDYGFLPAEKGERKYRLEGYLFPATYEFSTKVTAHEILAQMLDRFALSYANIETGNQSGLSADEVVILASLIESEIQVPQERAVAAGVMINRLEQGMLLQIDSCVQYALGTRNEVVTYDDLEVDSPYNTYKYQGLPVGPICNPGDEALAAAMAPEDNDYLYYVVEAKGSSNHVFCTTYDEFLAAKAAYQNSGN